MSDKKTGGPAFPELGNVGYNSDWQSENGMTLRDYFAGEALRLIRESSSSGFSHNPEIAAKVAYSYADAMLKAREE